MKKRVVVTGMGGVSPIGNDWPSVRESLKGGISGVQLNNDWAHCEGLQSRLAAPCQFSTPPEWERKKTRTMGRVSLLAAKATEDALRVGELLDHPALTDGSCGVAFGSTSGSPPAIEDYFRALAMNKSLKGLSPYTYIQLMSHTCAANLAQFFKIKGRVIPTCSACTSGSQAIGFAFESIRDGYQQLMIAGGAEELHLAAVAVFDVMFATSTQDQPPLRSPRPFDAARDGLVIGEGAGALVLEELEHALNRKAPVFAEVVGFGTNSDGAHITNPCSDGMEQAMRLALLDGNLSIEDIGYINAHGTATELGDIAESLATSRLFGNQKPISSLKSYMGHTLGACGALEAWMGIQMLREGWFSPTLHLETVDDRCGRLDYIQNKPRQIVTNYFMSNNFAFGGVNTSLVFKRWNK
ncbi:MAG: beta-ketoacyl-ACP synthase [Elusimicrobia bacterium]|nr:beta-ketoacyl-ACP synthase [Elusimicrobiota bacterium]